MVVRACFSTYYAPGDGLESEQCLTVSGVWVRGSDEGVVKGKAEIVGSWGGVQVAEEVGKLQREEVGEAEGKRAT